jgi:formylglycine-generating enzyme required for sulfatase activity
MLEGEPEDRFQTMAKVIEQLQSVSSRKEPPEPKPQGETQTPLTAEPQIVLPQPAEQARASEPLAAVSEGKAGERLVLKIRNVEYPFRWCPSGTFMMGSPSSETDRYSDETQHKVTLTQGFWMGETEVTQEMWESVTGNNPSEFKGAKLPVEEVSWEDCQKFIGQLNKLGVAPKGYKFSLPTEAQWEYACRAGTTTRYSFGNSLRANDANFDSRVGKTTEVGTYPANVWGLYDMHGNVWEWCDDWYGDYPTGSVTDPTGATIGSDRVFRGGGWLSYAEYCRSADRLHNAPSHRGNYLGLRVSLVSENR